MDPFEIKSVLDTFEIIVDSRERGTAKAEERYASFSAPWSRGTLDYGDYTYNCFLPNGESLLDPDQRMTPAVVVERKMSLDELAACLGRERQRFEREFQRAADHNAKVYLLIENATWEGILNHRYRSKLHPNAFFSSLTAWMIRYNMTVVFCKEGTSGKLIKEILYRDLKERLEHGEIGQRVDKAKPGYY